MDYAAAWLIMYKYMLFFFFSSVLFSCFSSTLFVLSDPAMVRRCMHVGRDTDVKVSDGNVTEKLKHAVSYGSTCCK